MSRPECSGKDGSFNAKSWGIYRMEKVRSIAWKKFLQKYGDQIILQMPEGRVLTEPVIMEFLIYRLLALAVRRDDPKFFQDVLQTWLQAKFPFMTSSIEIEVQR